MQSELFEAVLDITDKDLYIDFDSIWMNRRLHHVFGEYDYTMLEWYYLGTTCQITYLDENGFESIAYFKPL